MNKFSNTFLIVVSLLLTCSQFYTTNASAQINGQQPQGESCVVTAGNRNAPLAIDGSYTIFGIPGNLGAIRARATCSDGSVGQSAIGFTDSTQSITIPLGPIVFGQMDPVPLAVNLSANESKLNTGESSQLSLLAVAVDGSSRDVTNRSEGTVYSISNDLLGNITDNGLVSITSEFDTGSSARLVASATTEGSVSSTYMYVLGPQGALQGIVYRADGTTPVEGAQVSVLRLQPREAAGFSITDVNGRFVINDVNAGSFIVSVLDPSTGDRALAGASIETESQVTEVTLNLNGLAQVNVSVINDNDELVSDAEVTLTSLGAYYSVKTANTNSQGVASFTSVSAGDFTVSTRDPATGLLGTLVDNIKEGETLDLTLRLQEVGSINGVVYDVDGTTLVSGVQVRILSRQRGIISQSVTLSDGTFSFDTLPKADGPFILDAFVDGRLRARVPSIIYSEGEEQLERNIILSSVGTIRGFVKDVAGEIFANAKVTMQSLEGLHLSFDAYTNEQGKFVLPAVPVGDFELTAVTTEGRTGRESGRINADNENTNLDIVIASNTIIGTVYQRNGITPVSSGVKVYLAPRSKGENYSYENVSDVLSTVTNSLGKYGFPVNQAGDYYVQAESGLDRGRSRSILVNLDPSQPLETDVVFLAKGQVSGVVTDANGIIQEDVTVTVFTQGAFDASRSVQTNASGSYGLDGVFAGDIVVKAKNNTTKQTGLRQGRLDAEGEHINIDVTLSASGSIQGRVLEANNTIASRPIQISIYSNNILFSSFVIENGNSYQVDLVPLGDVKIVAEDLSTGNKGVATTRIDSLNEVKNIDVKLIGQGSLLVSLIDDSGNPVINALVTTTTQFPFVSSQNRTSDNNGIVNFEYVFAGDYNISANKEQTFGSLQGSEGGTLLPDEIKQTTVVLSAVAVGQINGVVYKSDGITPQGSGWTVRMLPEPYTDAYITLTDENGEYSFNRVNAGTYNIDVMAFFNRDLCPNRGRIRARASGVSLTTQDEIVSADIQFIGSGEVFGLITDANDNPTDGIKVTLTNPDPVYGSNVTCNGRTTYETTTDIDGNYRLFDIPAGNFTIIAENHNRTLQAQDGDRIKFDTDEVELNLTLIDNAVSMPYSFYDANGFLFDIGGDGSIGSGTRNVYAAAVPDNAAMRLEIVSNDIPVPFINGNGSIGRLISQGQEIEVDDITPSGLKVTRRILTPRSGYFSRYLEVLENPTDQPITVDVRIKSHHREDDSNPRVVDTSDGDQILSVINPSAPDRWLIVDDQTDADPFVTSSIPVTGHVFDGANADLQVSVANYELIGQTGKLTYQWNDITVAPGEKAILMHFVFNQIKRTGAREAAIRLVGLPPEAIDDLTTDDRAAVINFAIPDNSTLASLPNLDAGSLSGKVLSGDGVTTIANAKVKFVSQHPLFSRIRYTNSNANGQFEFHSTLDGTINNYVIPIFGYNLSATYSLSGASSAVTPGAFPVDVTQSEQDLVFVGAGDIRGNVLRHNGALVPEASIELCRLDNRSSCTDVIPDPSNKAISEADGSYVMYANTPRDYFLFASKEHPQSRGRHILGRATVTATAADVTVKDIVMEETGSVSGIVKASDGTPVSEAVVDLLQIINGNPRLIRSTISDTAGFYRFFDAPLGQHEVHARDVISNARGQVEVAVFLDQETVQDVRLEGTAILNIYVEYERGGFANNASVDLYDGSQYIRERSDSNGLAQFQVSVGNYSLRVGHPDRGSPLVTNINFEILPGESQVDKTVVLLGAGEIFGTIVRPDGTTLAGGFPYSITQIRGLSIGRLSSTTSATGAYRTVGLPLGDYIITAYDAEQDRFADAEFTIVIDGEEVSLDLTLLDERIALPANLHDANRFKFDVQQNGSLFNGSSAFADGASSLEIDGQVFVGDTSARLEAGKRQFAITQDDSLSGLTVTRKIYVPRGAYFSRHLETFDNPTTSDITVDIRLTHKFSKSEVLDTSSGDMVLSAQDNWLMVDDDLDADILLYNGQMPATTHIYSGELGVAPTIVDVSYNNLKPIVLQDWNQLTIPAGQRVSLLHFMVQQINQVGAKEAAIRLSQLPPEVLTDLTVSEMATIVNFIVPSDGISPLESLPPLTGNVNGVVLEGNENTPVPNTRVTVQSSHPLFSRIWGKQKDSSPACSMSGTIVNSLLSTSGVANYSLQGQLTETTSIAIPIGFDVKVVAQEIDYCYGQYSGHPFTNALSKVELVEASVVQDVIFNTGILTGTVIGSSDFSVTGGRLYRSIDDPDHPYYQYVQIGSDGNYVYPGLPPGTYDLLFDTSHPDKTNGDVLRGSRIGISVSLGQVLVSDVHLQPTGGVQGSISTFDGAQSVNTEITLDGIAANQNYDQCVEGCDANTLSKHKGKREVHRKTTSDSLGRYGFSAIPDGTYTMTVLDSVSGGITRVDVVVTENQVTIQNVILTAVGSATVTVVDYSNNPVIDSIVHILPQAQGFEEVAGRTDYLGQFIVPNIPLGSYTIRVTDPRANNSRYMDRTISGSIDSSGQANTHQLTLRSAATIELTVVDSDNGGIEVENASIVISDSRGQRNVGSTDGFGKINISVVPEGSYLITASAMINGVQKDELTTGSIANTDNGQIVQASIDLRSRLVSLPVTLYDANNERYDVSSSSNPRLLIDGAYFEPNTSVISQQGRREHILESSGLLSGLNVRRKVFVPRNGYFVRYIEMLANPSNTDITIELEINNQVAYQPAINMSSSGDAILNNGGNDPDLWFVSSSNNGGDDSSAYITSGENAVNTEPLLEYVYQSYYDRIAKSQWSSITIPANSQIQLLHFFSKQNSADSAIASAQRLAQLPPEALTGLTVNDVNEIVNFSIPVDLASTLPILPELTGKISGRALEGDGVTPVPDIVVKVKSNNPIFNREYEGGYFAPSINSLRTDLNGSFSIVGSLLDVQAPIAIPVDSSVIVSASRNGLQAEVIATFELEQNEVVQDLIFASGQMEGFITGVFHAQPEWITYITAIGSDGTNYSGVVNTTNGHYVIKGLPVGNYTLETQLIIRYQNNGNIFGYVDSADVAVGEITTQNIEFDPNGAVTGQVFSSTGIEQPNQRVELSQLDSNFKRSLDTGATGDYDFGAIPVGDYVVTVTSSTTGEQGSANVSVYNQQATNQDFTFLGIGTVNLTVSYLDGTLAFGSVIYLESSTFQDRKYMGSTDSNGLIIMQVPVGSYTLYATHPITSQESQLAGVVLLDNEIIENSMFLPAKANIRFIVVDADQNDLPIENVEVKLHSNDYSFFPHTGRTGVEGDFQFDDMREANFDVTIHTGGSFRSDYQSQFYFDISAQDDSQTLEYIIRVAESMQQINHFEFNTAHHLYQLSLKAGDILSPSIRAFNGAFGNACTILMTYYDSNGNQLYSGEAWTTYQSIQLNQIPVTVDGTYTIMLTPKYSSCSGGSYRLGASIDGQPISVNLYQDGGQVTGTLYQADGVNVVANELVQLTTTDGDPSLSTQVETDANGVFLFDRVPLGNFRLSYVNDPSVDETGVIDTLGQIVTQDLVLTPQTTLNINVLNADGTSLNRQVRLTIRNEDNLYFRPYTNSQGQYTYVYNGDKVVSINVTSPTNSQIKATQFVQPVDGQIIEVNLLLAPATVQGVIYQADGLTPLASAYIKVNYAQDNGFFLGSQYSNAQGEYLFNTLPTDNEIIFSVRDPNNYVYTVASVVTDHSQTTDLDIVLNGYGSVYGKLTGIGNTPIVNAEIYGSYSDNSINNNTSEIYAQTDVNGDYILNYMPIGQTLTISYTDWSFGEVSTQQTTSLSNHGDSSEVNLILPGAGINLQLTAADNLPITGECSVSLVVGVGEEQVEKSYYLVCDSLLGFVGLPTGQVSIQVSKDYNIIYTGSWSLSDNQLQQINSVVSVISGIITSFDSNVVFNADVFTSENWVRSDEMGQYRLLGLRLGTYRLIVQQSQTSLQTINDVEIIDELIPLNLDVQLPASGTINGQVLDVDATPMENITVFAASSNSTVVLQSSTDVNGDYEIFNIVVGDIELSAVNQTTSNIASLDTLLTSDGQIATHNLQFQQPGSVSGMVYDENASIYANSCVHMQYTRRGTVHQSLSYLTNSDANGLYGFDSAAAGQVLVRAGDDCYNLNIAAIEQADINVDSETVVDLQIGNATPLRHRLNELGNNFAFDLYSNGEIQAIKNNAISYQAGHRPFINNLEVLINGQSLNSQRAALINVIDEQIIIGPTTTKDLSMIRKVFVPSSGNYVRLIDSVTNTSNEDQEVTVKLQGFYGSDYDYFPDTNAILSVDPLSNSDRYAIHSYRTIDLLTDPAIAGYVFASSNILMPVETDFHDFRSAFSWSWTTTIPAGQTHSFLSYVLVGMPGDVSTVSNLSNEIINGTQVDMFNSLSTDDRANIINFEVPQ